MIMRKGTNTSIYEINTWVWLSSLSEQATERIDLGSVPAREWDAIAQYGFDIVWLMGVWERSPAGAETANRNPHLLQDFHRVLQDFRPEDNVGSAYCVRRYVVDQHLGGPEGLAIARQELARRGMGLLLDFVPNHVAPDSPWILEHPEHFIQANAADLKNHPDSYIRVGEKIFACGRDPYFPPWPDVVQGNAFNPEFRTAVLQRMLAVAAQCDGIRCDMAMLLINRIFASTWGGSVGLIPAKEFWPEVITAVKQQHPDFAFVAEAYWDLEWELQQQGFDLCYDKKLYDLLDHRDVAGIRLHLGADITYQDKLIRFIENHDEPRAAAAFSPAKARAAAIAIATLPGVKLFHEGQFEGRRTRIPVFLDRRPNEEPDVAWEAFYHQLLAATDTAAFRTGRWALCTPIGWPDNQSCQQLLAWCWVSHDERSLILINFSESKVEARIGIPWDDLANRRWQIKDTLSEASYDRDGSEMQNDGLYVELTPWAGQIFSFSQL